ncbi:Uu.00g063540.m01.CDS01 [Anthostomella pinea]|uniref:Plasma membrane fusion protein PRM1 n=1 Tax=Anthostomella pinea TaxID=933095 RepID=A0AAI8YMW4_9PEZI|nr:Uu.00g063540.m01.CDS01 [Anthostomella pinea]
MRDGKDEVPPPTPTSDITPYLGLRARYSQLWFNRWTILLLLVLVHFLLTIGSLTDGLTDAKVKALSACTKVEDIGSAMASMPHYLSVGVNQLTASSITHVVHALMTVLNMILTGIEQLILFVIGMMTDTYVCLVAMVVHGGLNASAVAVEKTTAAMNEVIDKVSDGVSSKADDIQGAIHTLYGAATSAADALNKVGDTASNAGNAVKTGVAGAANAAETPATGWLSHIGHRDLEGGDVVVEGRDLVVVEERDVVVSRSITIPPEPQIKDDIVNAMKDLHDINIDTSGFVDGLNDLNDKIPTFDELKNLTAQAVDFPFNLIRQELDKAYGNWTFDDSVFPVADKKALSFCSDNSGLNDFFEKLFKLASEAKIAAVVVLSALAIAACIPMAYMEKRRWRRQNAYARIFSKHSFDGLDVGYMYSRPMTARAGLVISTKIAGKDNQVRGIMTRWAIAYATSLPAIFVLSLALAGFFSCLCQIILLKTIEKEVPAITQEVANFANETVGALVNVSAEWAHDANGVITSFSNEINDDILGKVTNATTAVNDTLNTFMSEIDKGLNTAFGNTLFKDFAADAVRCLLGLKVEAVQRGLTWVHDNAHINFPLFDDDIFSAGADKSVNGDSDLKTFLATPSAVTTDEVSGAVTHVTTWLYNNIVQEALIATALLLIYVVVVLGGVIYAMGMMVVPPKSQDNMPNPPMSPGLPRSKSESRMSDSRNGTVWAGQVTEHPPARTRMSRQATFEDEKR